MSANNAVNVNSLWKYEGKTNTTLSYRLHFPSFKLNDGVERVKDGELVLPNVLAISYNQVQYSENGSKQLCATLTFNPLYFSYDKSSNTLKLVKDVKLDETLIISGDMNLDLNGHVMTGADGKNAIELTKGGSINVTNSNETKKGQIRGGQGLPGENGAGGIYAPSSSESKVTVADNVKVSGGRGGDANDAGVG